MTSLPLSHHLSLPDAMQLMMELMAEREHLMGLMKGDWNQATLEWTLNPSSANPYLLTARFESDQTILLSIEVLESKDAKDNKWQAKQKEAGTPTEEYFSEEIQTTLENISNDFQSIADIHAFNEKLTRLFDGQPELWWQEVEKHILRKYFAIYASPGTASLVNKGILGVAAAACLILFVMAAFKDRGIMTFTTQTALKLGAFYNISVVFGEWYRLFTGAFFHFGFAHLTYNLLFFLMAGAYVVRRHGVLYFLIFLWAATPLPFAVEMLFYSNEPLVSGGISSIITSMLGLLIVRQASSYTAGAKTLLAFLGLAIAYFLISGWFANLNIEEGEERVSNIGHIAGLLAGLFFGLMTNRMASFRTPLRQNLLASSLAAGLILLGITWGCVRWARGGDIHEAVNILGKAENASDSLINTVMSYNDSSDVQRSEINLSAAETLEEHVAAMDDMLGWKLSGTFKETARHYRNYIAAERDYYQTFHEYFSGNGITDEMLEAATLRRDSLWKVYEDAR